MRRKGFASILILLIFAAALVVGGIWYYGAHMAARSISVASCSDFGQFSSFVLANAFNPALNIGSFKIVGSSSGGSDDVFPYTGFRWRRNRAEPFVSYPVIAHAGTSTYDYHLDGATIQAETDFASSNLGAKLPEEASALGFAPDDANTVPFVSDVGVVGTRIFGFTKGGDMYSVVLSEEKNYQAPGGVSVGVACSRRNAAYDALYDALNLRAATSTHDVETGALLKDAYDDDYVQVEATSSDGTVYELIGDSARVPIADYYYFNGATPLLVSSDSAPVDCSVLEKMKIGAGMACQ